MRNAGVLSSAEMLTRKMGGTNGLSFYERRGATTLQMKAIFLTVLLAGAALLTGCETVAVVDRRPAYGHTSVYYSSGRPYYYTGGVRYWGYPRGYSGYRYRNYDYDSGRRYGYSRNVEVERNTYVVNNNRTVYRDRDRNVRYRSQNVDRSSNVKVKGRPPGQVKKKKVDRT